MIPSVVLLICVGVSTLVYPRRLTLENQKKGDAPVRYLGVGVGGVR